MNLKKYIVFDCCGKEVVVAFDDDVQHKELNLEVEEGWCKPIAAGFYTIKDGKAQVEGFSKSLGLQSRPQDAALLQKLL